MSIPRQTQILEKALSPFILPSSSSKPVTGIVVGQKLYEPDTGYSWIFNGAAWVPLVSFPFQSVFYKQISLNQSPAVYDVSTATAQNLFIDAVVVHVPDDLTEVEDFTGISVATDDDPAITIFSSDAGAKAELVGNFHHVFRGPVVTASTKKVQLTIGGAAAGANKVANISIFWRPVVAGGYFA